MFFYSDTEPKGSVQVNIWELDATHMYMKHFTNLLFLQFMAKNGTLLEKLQSEKEIIICNRKLDFWKKMPNFDKDKCNKLMNKEATKWEIKL